MVCMSSTRLLFHVAFPIVIVLYVEKVLCLTLLTNTDAQQTNCAGIGVQQVACN